MYNKTFYDRSGRMIADEDLCLYMKEYKPIFDKNGREVAYEGEILDLRDEVIRKDSEKELSHCKQYYDRNGRALEDYETCEIMESMGVLYDKNGRPVAWTEELKDERDCWMRWKKAKNELSHGDQRYYDMSGRELSSNEWQRYIRDNMPLYDRSGNRVRYEIDRDMNRMRNDLRNGGSLRHGDDSMVAAEISPVSKGMGKKDILDRVAGHDLMDEVKVANKYLDYAHAVKDECPETARLFAQMAYEEYTHAHVQRDILLKNGYKMTDDGEDQLHDLKKRLEATFRGSKP